MIAVYCSSESGGQLIARHLGERSLIARRWSVLEDASLAAEAAVVCFEFDTTLSLQHFDRFRQHRRGLPLVIVTNRYSHQEEAGFANVGEAVYWDQVERHLWSTVERALEQLPRRRIADEIRTLPHIPFELRRALIHLCRASEPIRTVTELARETGCSRTRLAQQWRSVTGHSRRGSLRLEDAVDWMLVLRALRMKTPADSWCRISEALEVADYTLGRITRRLANCTLQELELRGHGGAVALFRAALLRQLTKG